MKNSEGVKLWRNENGKSIVYFVKIYPSLEFLREVINHTIPLNKKVRTIFAKKNVISAPALTNAIENTTRYMA